MHELSITKGILDLAIAKAREANSDRIVQIDLVIGDASSIIDDSVQFCFDFVSRDTIAQGARLNFHRVPVEMKCRRCGSLFGPEAVSWACPKCSEWDVEMVRGTEFYMESIEVD